MADISKITLPDGSTYDLKDSTARKVVKQTVKSDNKEYKILTTSSDSPTSGANAEAAYDAGITINPKTHTLTATNLKGILSTQDLKRPTGLRGLNDVTLQALVNNTRANRLAFLPADQIIIEKTTDGGTTWVDAGVSDAAKLGLFSETRTAVYLPMIDGARSILCGLRITITAMKYNVPNGTSETEKYNYWNSTYVRRAERYCQLKDMYFWLSAVSDSIGVTVQRATGANSNTWTNIFNDTSYYMTGWSACDYINFGQHTFGGSINQTGQPWNYRIILMTKGVNGTDTMATSSTTQQQSIMEIRGYGDNVWIAPNNYMTKDHIYNFDVNQNTIFPANITATKFIGPLQGNASTATSAGKLQNTSKVGDTNKPVYFTANGVPAEISYTIDKSVPSTAVFTDTTYTFADGAAGNFTVTPSGGSAQIVSIGKPATAGTADSAKKLASIVLPAGDDGAFKFLEIPMQNVSQQTMVLSIDSNFGSPCGLLRINTKRISNDVYQEIGWIASGKSHPTVRWKYSDSKWNLYLVKSSFDTISFHIISATNDNSYTWKGDSVTAEDFLAATEADEYVDLQAASAVEDANGNNIADGVLRFAAATVSAGTAQQILSISNAKITADYVLDRIEFADPSYITTSYSWTTSAGSFTLTGTATAATTANVLLIRKGN